MNEILSLVQLTLDTLLSPSSIHSFWGRRGDDQGDEYVIYGWESDPPEVSADADVYCRIAQISVQYYIKYGKARTISGRKTATERMDGILAAMRSAGFGCPLGWAEIGDVDDVGFATFRADFEIPHMTEPKNV